MTSVTGSKCCFDSFRVNCPTLNAYILNTAEMWETKAGTHSDHQCMFTYCIINVLPERQSPRVKSLLLYLLHLLHRKSENLSRIHLLPIWMCELQLQQGQTSMWWSIRIFIGCFLSTFFYQYNWSEPTDRGHHICLSSQIWFIQHQ